MEDQMGPHVTQKQGQPCLMIMKALPRLLGAPGRSIGALEFTIQQTIEQPIAVRKKKFEQAVTGNEKRLRKQSI